MSVVCFDTNKVESSMTECLFCLTKFQAGDIMRNNIAYCDFDGHD